MDAHPVTEFISPSAWALVESKFSPFAKDTLAKLCKFVEEDCLPAQSTFHDQISTDPALRWKSYPKIMEELKAKARSLGLWNLFLSKEHYPDVGVPLTNLEYAVMAEVMGRCVKIAPEACNCSAPDTGNMEVLARYGTQKQKDEWLKPLLAGKTRSSFAMTEKGIASSDATNIQTSIRVEGNEIVVNGHKWWISGAGDPRNAIHLVMGKSDVSATKHQQQSIVIVPANAKGVKLVRPMHVFGYDDAPEGHFEVVYDNVRIPLENIIGGWGRGFEIIQGRLGPGRMVTDTRKVMFGKMLYEHGTVVEKIAKSRMEIDQARLMVMSAALQIDLVRAKGAMMEIGMAKAIVPAMVNEVIDRAMQVHGADLPLTLSEEFLVSSLRSFILSSNIDTSPPCLHPHFSEDTDLAALWSGVRTLRYADGPDEVHISQVGTKELKKAPALHLAHKRYLEREEKVRLAAGVKDHVFIGKL
ncbi:hypothetical protein P7C70_g3442, partial [Phenoliferia sp. Uapishka_3]